MKYDDGFVIRLLFDERRDGRFHVHSPDVPGLHLAGQDIHAIRADVEPVLKDVLLHNARLVVDRIEWHPTPVSPRSRTQLLQIYARDV